MILAAAGLRLLLGLVRRPGLFGTLVLPGVETKTLEANRALEALAARIRSDPALAALFAQHAAADLWAALELPAAPPPARAFLADLRTFLDRYGHRETAGTLQLSQPTWRDAPEAVLGLLQGLARAEARPPAAYPAWLAARDEVLARPALRLPPLRAAFGALLTNARLLPQLREDTRFYATMILPVLRRTVLEIAARLVAVGALDIPDDVYFLRLGDLAAIRAWPPAASQVAALRALVARRQARWAALATTPLVDPRLFRATGAGPDVLVQGTPGSPGVAAGPVRVIRDSTEFGALQPGDVLVAPYTNPAWTPLFQRAAAVVVDSGGPASHAAIVAREYGIPAVMGTVDGTARLAPGARVRVDGHRGFVTRAAPDGSG